MAARRFLNVVSRIANPRKHLFYPSTANAQQHRIQQQQIANAKVNADMEVTAEEQSSESESEETTYSGVLRLPTPKLRFNSRTNLSFDFLPFYSGTGIEVVRQGSGLLRMIKHKFTRLDTSIHSIL